MTPRKSRGERIWRKGPPKSFTDLLHRRLCQSQILHNHGRTITSPYCLQTSKTSSIPWHSWNISFFQTLNSEYREDDRCHKSGIFHFEAQNQLFFPKWGTVKFIFSMKADRLLHSQDQCFWIGEGSDSDTYIIQTHISFLLLQIAINEVGYCYLLYFGIQCLYHDVWPYYALCISLDLGKLTWFIIVENIAVLLLPTA